MKNEELNNVSIKFSENDDKKKFSPIQHSHVGTETPKIKVSDLRDDINLFKTITSYPTTTPGNSWLRIRVLTSAGSTRLFIYDTTSSTWKSVIIS